MSRIHASGVNLFLDKYCWVTLSDAHVTHLEDEFAPSEDAATNSNVLIVVQAELKLKAKRVIFR